MQILKTLFALLVLGLLLLVVDLDKLRFAFAHVTLEILVLLLAISVPLIYVSALKWRLFLDAFGNRRSLPQLFNLYLIGYFINSFLPSYVGGDALRSWYAADKDREHEALAATVLERYTGLVAMVVLSLIFVWGVELVTQEIKLLVILLGIGLIVGTAVALSRSAVAAFSKLPVLGKFSHHLERIQRSFKMASENKMLLVKSLGLSFIFHTFTVVNVIVAGYAVGWINAPVWDLFVVLPLILLIGAVPIAPSGLGIQEGAYFYFLAGIGATPEQALGVGLLLRLKAYLIALIGGVIWLRIKRPANQTGAGDGSPVL